MSIKDANQMQSMATMLALGVPTSGSENAEPVDRRQAAILALGRRAIVSPDVTLLMQDAVEVLAETLEADSGGVAELSADSKSLVLRWAAATDQQHQHEIIHRYEMGEQNSLAGYALSVARPVTVTDLAHETRFKDTFLLSQRVHSAIACPMTLLNQSFGTLAIYRTRSEPFAAHDALFLETVSHLVTTTVARERAEKMFEEGKRFNDSLWKGSKAPAMVVDAEGLIERVNPACTKLTGFAIADVQSRPVRGLLFGTEESAEIEKHFQRARQGRGPVQFRSPLLTKNGNRRQVEWSLEGVKNDKGKVTSIIASGIDVTEEIEMRAKIEMLGRPVENPATGLPDIIPDHGLGEEDRPLPALQRLVDGPGSERRVKPRRAYPYVQWIAPMVDGKLPPRSEFREVRCRDISAGGFSFIVPRPPASDFFVVAFGAGSALTYLVAQAVHCNRITRDGITMYVVGCHYTSRVKY